jgi:hypothetical protein
MKWTKIEPFFNKSFLPNKGFTVVCTSAYPSRSFMELLKSEFEDGF